MRCPICDEDTTEAMINYHLDRGCPKKRKLESSQPSTLPSTPPDKVDPRPLAELMRPTNLDEYIGQKHLVGPNGALRRLIESDKVPSIILWGPAGVGKTSFARLISSVTKSRFVEMSATTASVSDIKNCVCEAKKHFNLLKQRTILFLDEVHRFNRTQQDSLLPSVENGDITLIAATTENPSFKLQGALMSRCQVFTLEKLSDDDLYALLIRAINTVKGKTPDEIVKHIAEHSKGDARVALNMLEMATSLPESMDVEAIKASLKTLASYDQKGDGHYDMISAFHKSIRGSDADATLYYLARMIDGGEDPLYISRRMVRIASEDVGLADDSCLPFAVATHTSVQQIGLPECDVILAHCAVKLARAVKDVEVYKAWGLLRNEIGTRPRLRNAPVPMHLRNAPTKMMEEMGYGDGYKYNPRYVSDVEQEYLPTEVTERWLGRWQPDMCDFCETDVCEHLSGNALQDFE